MSQQVTDLQFPALTRLPMSWSAPLTFDLPTEYKSADFNKRQGLVTAYLTVYANVDGTPYIDPYKDIVEPGSFTKTIAELEAGRQSKNNPWLCPSLWQHERNNVIGGVKGLTADSKGIIYETQLAMGLRQAQEAFELLEQKMLGSSYGYDPLRYEPKNGIRHLQEIRLREQSFVTFPANHLAPILSTKSAPAEEKKIFPGVSFPSIEMTTSAVASSPPPLPSPPSLPNPRPTSFTPDVPEVQHTLDTLYSKKSEAPDETPFNLEDVLDHTLEENFSEELLHVKAVVGSTGFPIGPRDEAWSSSKAEKQYKAWGTDKDGKAIPGKYKKVHLKVDGDPKNITSYHYPFCYIVDGSPQICVGAVKACVAALGGARGADAGTDASGMLTKCRTMYTRINKKYPDAPELSIPKDAPGPNEVKESPDFLATWGQRAEDAMMSVLYSMNSAMMRALTATVDDDDLDGTPTSDQTARLAAINTILSQFQDAVTSWLPMYQQADDLSDEYEDDDPSVVANVYGSCCSASMTELALKDLHADLSVKTGRVLSNKNRKRLQATLLTLHRHIADIEALLTETDPHAGKSPAKAAPDDAAIDITQELKAFWNTSEGAPASPPGTPHQPTPFPQKAAPISFPQFPPQQGEVLITNLLAELQTHMGVKDAPNPRGIHPVHGDSTSNT